MYSKYFGLKENSFSITPDPHYLYLSQRHREALAHLLYGAGEGGGFVLLTGEVGTGKTTVCRAFLEQSPDKIDIALILNPSLTVTELLQSICQEFSLAIPDEAPTNKVLLDKLNEYLLHAHSKNRRAVLLIDEAQNLKRDVLEQIRLLTNLETPKQKLLQIFLVGQPELRELLKRPDLRQLAQRITARYHLTPLNEAETSAYIQHRLATAGVTRKLFDPKSTKLIYNISGGVPRLINILCDRSLLGAYASNKSTVDKSIVRSAAKELSGEEDTPKKSQHIDHYWKVALLIILIAVATFQWKQLANQEAPASVLIHLPENETSPSQSATIIQNSPANIAEADQPVIKPESLTDIGQYRLDWGVGINALLSNWSIRKTTDSPAPCDMFDTHGLLCREVTGTWNNLKQYDRPALIRLQDAEYQVSYVLVTGIDGHSVRINNSNSTIDIDKDVLDIDWYGTFYFLWKPYKRAGILISEQSSANTIHWLNQQLSLAGYPAKTMAQYSRTQVIAFQLAHGLNADGVAGQDTLIKLNSLNGDPAIPHLEQMN